MVLRLGRYVLGLAAISVGLITLIWHQIDSLGNLTHPGILVYIAGIAELAAGFALLWRRTVKIGAILFISIFSIFSLYWIPQVMKTPLDFSPYGNFFEQFSIVIGGIFVYAFQMSNRPASAATLERAAYISYGISVITYSLYQLFYLTYTASLVPKWIPPGQMFWAVATTIAFALAAIAILSGRPALLASILLTLMIVLFGLLIWVPACIIHPHRMSNWVENSSNLAMIGTAWMVVEYLSKKNSKFGGAASVRS